MEAKLVFNSTLLQNSLDADSDNEAENHSSGEPHQQIMHATWISDDGYKMAIGYADCATSTNMTIVVRDLKTSKDLTTDVIRHCNVNSTSVSWLTGRIGFFYTTMHPHVVTLSAEGENDEDDISTPKVVSRVMFHKLGTLQRDDLVVYEHVSAACNKQALSTIITSDGHYLMIEIYKSKGDINSNSSYRLVSAEHTSLRSAGNKVYYFDLTKFDGKLVKSLGTFFKLVDTFSYRFQYISNIEEDFWFRTNYKAPNFRVVRISLPEYHVNYTAPTEAYDFKLLMSWKAALDWIPERVKDGGFLETAGIAAHTVLVLKYLINGVHEVLLYDLTSTLQDESQIPVADLPHPPYGTISGPNCNFYSSEIFYHYSDLSDPGSIYRAIIKRDVCTGSIEISFDQLNSIVIPGVDKYEFETRQEFIPISNPILAPLGSAMGVSSGTTPRPPTGLNSQTINKISILLFGTRKLFDAYDDDNTTAPCILYAHSGFGVCTNATFNLPLLVLAKHFKVLIAVVNVEGSGIYGAPYYAAGIKANKQRSLDDLRSAVHYLVDTKKYTSHSQLGLYGGGNGGLLIGGVMTTHPSILAAAVITDGLFDMVKYHQFNARDPEAVTPFGATRSVTPPNTPATSQKEDSETVSPPLPYWQNTVWYNEYGCVEESKEECARLAALSPLHRVGAMHVMRGNESYSEAVSEGAQGYPAVMLNISNSGSTNSVSFKHSLKFIAELQRVCNPSDLPERPLILDFLDHEDEFLHPSITPSINKSSTEVSPQVEVKVECDTQHDIAFTSPSLDKISGMLAFLVKNINAGENADPVVVTPESTQHAISNSLGKAPKKKTK
eukprot:gene25888-32395_t